MDVISQILSIVFWFIIILIPLVAIHEFGHLLMARLFGVKVLEYGIGIPPRILSRKWKGIIWSLNYIPLGGFARIYGDNDAIDLAHEHIQSDPNKAREEYISNRLNEIIGAGDLKYFLEENNLEYNENWRDFEKNHPKTPSPKLEEQLHTLISWEYDTKITSKDTFFNKNLIAKIFILLGGILFNLATAFVLFFLMFGVISTPVQPLLLEDYNQIKQEAVITSKSEYITLFSVLKDSPAYKAGIRPGDELINLGGRELTSIQNFDEFRDLIDQNKGQIIPVTYINKSTGEKVDSTVNLEMKDGKSMFGVNSAGFGYLVSFRAKDLGSAFAVAGERTWTIFLANFKALGDIVLALLPSTQDKTALEGVGGPIAVGEFGGRIFSFQGISGVLNVMAIVSIGLAALNLLPIPALDGGRILLVTLSSITRKRNRKLEMAAISITFVLLLGLGLLIAFNDVTRIAQGRGF